ELGDPLAQRCGNTLTGVFVPGTRIALSAFRNVRFDSPDELTLVQEPVLIHMVEETSMFEEPALRSILAEANATFCTLQQLGCGQAVRGEYARVSCAYRGIIRACLEKLELEKKSPEVRADDRRLERLQGAMAVFYAIECVWHLFEILYVQQCQLVVPQLLEWARFHFPHTEERATDLLLMGEEAGEADPETYWEVLRSLVRLGEIDVTRAILAQSRKAQQPAYKTAEQVLKGMPVYKDNYALQKFLSQWEYWSVDTRRKLEANVFVGEPELEQLIQLVAGDKEQWDAGIRESDDWYQYLPGYLLYSKPTCKPFELRIAAANWLNRWALLRPGKELTSMGRMVLQLMQHDVKLFVFEAQRMSDSHWFSAHLIDIIYNAGTLRSYFDQNNIDLPALRHSIIYEYGSQLMSSSNLWQLGVDYLDQCKQEGRAAIELLLPRIFARSERQASKLLAMAKKRGLLVVEQDICKVLSKRAFDSQRYGSAIEWAIRSKDVLLVTGIADFILKHYSRTGTMLCPDTISSVGGRMFLAPRLVFLSKYFEFYEFYRHRDFLAASELLINLLQSKITPDYFWPSLLIDAMPLLESKDPKIFSKETVSILHHIETELVPLIERNVARYGEHNTETVFKDYRVENVNEILNLMRLACARNLARAVIIENTVPVD
ncbi:hypothetical protein KR018_012058, partial [Drosophila ironensis]